VKQKIGEGHMKVELRMIAFIEDLLMKAPADIAEITSEWIAAGEYSDNHFETLEWITEAMKEHINNKDETPRFYFDSKLMKWRMELPYTWREGQIQVWRGFDINTWLGMEVILLKEYEYLHNEECPECIAFEEFLDVKWRQPMICEGLPYTGPHYFQGSKTVTCGNVFKKQEGANERNS